MPVVGVPRTASATALGGRATRWRATGMVLLLCAAPWPAARTETTFDSVVTAIQRKDSQHAITDLVALANRGDVRAQYWLGLAYLEAKWVNRNIPQALSWLQIAADGYEGSFATSAADEARQTLLTVGPQVAGSDLIKADQITAAFLASYNSVLTASKRQGSDALLAAASASATSAAAGVTTGCALDASQGGCPKAATQLTGERCRGPFPEPQTDASTSGPGTDVRRPSYPVDGRRAAWEGRVLFLAHVDRSGFVCRVTLIQNSGFEQLDEATLRAVRAWRWAPAEVNGQPIEAIQSGSVDFLITDLQFK